MNVIGGVIQGLGKVVGALPVGGGRRALPLLGQAGQGGVPEALHGQGLHGEGASGGGHLQRFAGLRDAQIVQTGLRVEELLGLSAELHGVVGAHQGAETGADLVHGHAVEGGNGLAQQGGILLFRPSEHPAPVIPLRAEGVQAGAVQNGADIGGGVGVADEGHQTLEIQGKVHVALLRQTALNLRLFRLKCLLGGVGVQVGVVLLQGRVQRVQILLAGLGLIRSGRQSPGGEQKRGGQTGRPKTGSNMHIQCLLTLYNKKDNRAEKRKAEELLKNP